MIIQVTPANLNIESISQYAKIPGKKIVLLGRPGSGKTTAVKRILASSLGQFEMIPVLLERDWFIDIEKIPINVRKIIGTESESSFKTLEASERLLFIYDALDQVENPQDRLRQIDILSTMYFKNSHYLVTCREEEYATISHKSDFIEQHIKELDWTAMTSFIARMDNPNDKRYILGLLSSDEGLINICINQFIFIMMIRLLRERKVTGRLSSNVYENFLECFLKEWESYAKLSKKYTTNEIRIYLEEVASHIAFESDNKDDVSIDLIKEVISEDVLSSLLHHGFLERIHAKVKFFQHTFQEFLFASWLHRKRILPCDFSVDSEGALRYKKAYLSHKTIDFYKEIIGYRIIA